MNDSCTSTSCIATLMRIWSKYFFCSYTTLHFRFTRRVVSGITADNTSVGRNQRPQSIPKARKNLGADSKGKIMKERAPLKRYPKKCVHHDIMMTEKWDESWTAPITYYLQWSIWLMVSFDLVCLAPETRHATSSCCSKIHHTCLFDAGNLFPQNPWNSPQVGQILGEELVNFDHIYVKHLMIGFLEGEFRVDGLINKLCQEFLWESRWVLPKGAGLWMGSQEEHLGRIVPVLRDITMPQEGKSTLTIVGGSTGTFLVDDFLPFRSVVFVFRILFGFCWILHPWKQTENESLERRFLLEIMEFTLFRFYVNVPGSIGFPRTRFLGNSHSQYFSKMCEVPKAINTWIFERDFPIAAAWSYFQHIIHLHPFCCVSTLFWMLLPHKKGKRVRCQGKCSDRFAHLFALGQLEAVAQPADHDEWLLFSYRHIKIF